MKANNPLRRRFAWRTIPTLGAAALLLASMLAALGAGPDDSAGATASNTGAQWQVFEGHAFADSRIVPTGVSLVACLGGCEDGYISEPVAIGQDGRYSGLMVEPGGADRSALPDADVITFWLVGHDDRVSAVQSWLFTGDGRTRELHLSFHKLPVPSRGVTTSAGPAGTVTTDPDDTRRWRAGPGSRAHSPRLRQLLVLLRRAGSARPHDTGRAADRHHRRGGAGSP